MEADGPRRRDHAHRVRRGRLALQPRGGNIFRLVSLGIRFPSTPIERCPVTVCAPRSSLEDSRRTCLHMTGCKVLLGFAFLAGDMGRGLQVQKSRVAFCCIFRDCCTWHHCVDHLCACSTTILASPVPWPLSGRHWSGSLRLPVTQLTSPRVQIWRAAARRRRTAQRLAAARRRGTARRRGRRAAARRRGAAR